MQKQDNAQAGYLTFGPYEQLDNGEYRFELAYVSSVSTNTNVGVWDLALARKGKAHILQEGKINGTDGAEKKIFANFTLASDKRAEKIEIRTFANSDLDLKVLWLRVERTQ